MANKVYFRTEIIVIIISNDKFKNQKIAYLAHSKHTEPNIYKMDIYSLNQAVTDENQVTYNSGKRNVFMRLFSANAKTAYSVKQTE